MADLRSESQASLLARMIEILNHYNKKTEPISEIEIADALERLNTDVRPSVPIEYTAEIMAFRFAHKGQNSIVSRTCCVPGEDVPSEILAYWANRVNQVDNPVMRARYAGLVWDLGGQEKGLLSKRGELGRIMVDCTVQIAEQDRLEEKPQTIARLSRALSLALLMKDKTRIHSVTGAIITYEDRIAIDDESGTWGFAYDLLWNRKGITLSASQEAKLISDLEARFERIVRSQDPWATEELTVRIANYYRNSGLVEIANRFVRRCGDVFEAISAQASPVLALELLGHMQKVFAQFGMRHEADRVAVKLRQLGPSVTKGLKTIESSVMVDSSQIDRAIERLIEGNFVEALRKIAFYFVPNTREFDELLDDLKKEGAMSLLITTQIVDGEGRPVTSIGPLDTDREGHLVYQISQALTAGSFLLRGTLDRLVSKFGADSCDFADAMAASSAFGSDRRDIIEKGIAAYLEGDYIVAVHLLIPQVENAIRNLVERSGGAVLKPRDGGFDLRSLDNLLRDDLVSSALGDDASLYFRVVMTDQRGGNLRNKVCHGIVPSSGIGWEAADRIVHIMLCLGLIRES